MVSALGFSTTSFDPYDPGRLCRGRERWIDPWEPDEPVPPLQRLVVTGASFSDDSAADALRGLHHAGVDVATALGAMFARKPLIAFTEDGHPADIPEGAEAVELYTGHRAGGQIEGLFVRWAKKVSGVRELREVLGDDPDTDRVRGFLLFDEEVEIDDALMARIFLLVGMSSLDSPPSRFQPAALPDLLDVARAVVLLHRDKHGVALGIYTKDPHPAASRLIAHCDKEGILTVPFAIPPMLARWDRALAEARVTWEARRVEPFPVPVAPEQSSWPGRRRDRRSTWAAEAEAADAIVEE